MTERALRRGAGALALVTLVQVLLPVGPGRAMVQCAMNIVAALAIMRGVRLHRPQRPLGWYALALAMWCAAASCIGWALRLAAADLPFVRWLETGPKLGVYVGLLLSAVALHGFRRLGRDREGFLDAATVLLAGMLLAYEVWREPAGSPRGTDQAIAVGLGLLIATTVILGVRAILTDRRRPPSFYALIGAGTIFLVANVGLALAQPISEVLEPAYVVMSGLVAFAALHPSMDQVTHPSGAAEDRWLFPGMLLGLCAALLVNPALLVLASLRQGREGVVPAVGVGLLTILVLWRIGRLVGEREAARRTLALREQRFRSLLRHAADVIAETDIWGRLTYISPAVAPLLGRPVESYLGRPASVFVRREDRPALAEALRRLEFDPLALASVDLRLVSVDGRQHWVEAKISDRRHDPSVGGWVVNLREVTERKALEEQLTHQAFHDPLTGLANRVLFTQRVEHAIALWQRIPEGLAVLFCDLDDFKTVNDSLGHAAGDELLRQVATRLVACLRPGDTAARLGGDEFGILLEGEEGAARAGDVAQRLLAAVSEPLRIDGLRVAVQCSVGIALVGHGATAASLLRDADVAMYAAKTSGKGRSATFDPAMYDRARHRLALKADLPRALAGGELFLAYQPIVDLGSFHVRGVEALLRWQHPQRGLMAPAEFVPLAEETGQIVAIGRWVLGEACREAHAWRERFPFRRLRVSVNVSGVQLRDGRLVEDVRWALEAARLPADDLVLELTETVLMRETDATLEVLRGLRDLGVRLAVDDFGTGYASLTYLQRFPVEVLKIDRAFVSELGSGDEGQGRLARGIVDLARALEIDTVAEGIEDAGQLADLRRLGCRLGQGRFFAEPLSPAEVDVLLSRQRPRGTAQTARTGAEVAVG